MKQRLLGNSGLMVSELCLGTMNFGESIDSLSDCSRILYAARQSGINFIDCANVYGKSYGDGQAEIHVGASIRDCGLSRDTIVLATKVGNKMQGGEWERGLSRRHILSAVDASLKRLKTDYIDLYQIHRFDPETPIIETIETMGSLIEDGKIRYWGHSVFASWMMSEYRNTARRLRIPIPISEQAAYNLLDRRIENDRMGYIHRIGLGLLTWSPLGGGQLTGKYGSTANLVKGDRVERSALWKERANLDSFAISSRFAELFQSYGIDPAVGAVAWVLGRPDVSSVIIGPRTPEQVISLATACDTVLPAELLSQIDDLVPPGTAVADFLNNSGWQVGKIAGLAKAAERH